MAENGIRWFVMCSTTKNFAVWANLLMFSLVYYQGIKIASRKVWCLPLAIRKTRITRMMVGLMGIRSDSSSSITMPTTERNTIPTSSWFHLNLQQNIYKHSWKLSQMKMYDALLRCIRLNYGYKKVSLIKHFFISN